MITREYEIFGKPGLKISIELGDEDGSLDYFETLQKVGFYKERISSPYFFVDNYIFRDWLYRALIFLVISCPCALVISIPLGYFGGIGAASRNGILFKALRWQSLYSINLHERSI